MDSRRTMRPDCGVPTRISESACLTNRRFRYEQVVALAVFQRVGKVRPESSWETEGIKIVKFKLGRPVYHSVADYQSWPEGE